MTVPGEFAEPLARVSHRLSPFGTRVLWYAEIGSTNDAAAALAEDGAAEGAVVIADAQHRGRGRLGRTWVSPAGAGIYASIVLRPAAHVASFVTLAAGLAVAEGIQTATGLAPRLKWPNDVFVDGPRGVAGGRKLAGILAEAGGSPERGDAWIVLGFGINVSSAAYPPDVAVRATSLEAELGREVDRGLVFAECVAALAARYADVRERRSAALIAEWRTRAAATFGRRVEWDTPTGTQRGVAQDVDDAGALLVRSDAGMTRIISGEVRWI